METSTGLSSSAIYDLHALISLAALFKDNFSIDWIVELTGKKASQVLSELEKGVRLGCLKQKSPGVYCFDDLKIRQTYLDRLSLDQKEYLHLLISKLLLRDLPDDDKKIQSIAWHLLYINNNDIEKCHWLLKAGDLHLRSFQPEDALQCYSKAIQDLSNLYGEEADILFAEGAIKYSKISTARIDTNEVIRVLTQALRRVKKRNNETSQALIELHLAKNEWLRSRFTNSVKHFKRGFSLAEDLGNPKLLRSANTFGVFSYYWQGRFLDAVSWYQRTVPDVEKYPGGRFPLMAALTVGRCYAHIGQITQGLGMLDSIRAHCREKGDLYLAFRAEAALGAITLDIFRLKDAFSYLESSVEDASHWDNNWIPIMGNLMLSFAHYLNGNNKKCISYLDKYMQKTNKVHVTMRHYHYIIELCWAMKQGKLPNVHGLSLENEISRSIRGENVFMKGVAYRYQALLQGLHSQPQKKVMRSLELSMRWLKEAGHQIELAMCYLEMARQYLLVEDKDRASETARKAYDILSPFNEKLFPDDLRFLVEAPLSSENLLNELLNLGGEMAAIRSSKDLVHYIISTVNRITGAERGAIFLLEGKERPPILQLRASKNLTSENIDHPSFGFSMKMIKQVALTGKGKILVPDEKEPVRPNDVIHSRICVPMILRENTIGVLYHDNRLLKNVFNESDLHLLSYFAAQAAIALDNIRVYEENQRLSQKLTEKRHYFEEKPVNIPHFEGIIGRSPVIRRLLERVEQVAKTNTTVLITGATGVGKELIANAIHQHSPRCKKPFIKVPCNALPESLILSELFGHENGSFTGATRQRLGRFELAHRGTIFLDEIGDLPLEAQARLLGVLQGKRFERVGGNKTIYSDFRLIAATNRDLEKKVHTNEFRADLYYRLHVFPVYVPLLRERKEDIPALAYHFLKIYSAQSEKVFYEIPEQEMQKLMNYDWPGNIRELENVIESSCVSSTDYHLRISTLGNRHQEFHYRNPGITLKENEGLHILWALKKTGWKVRGPGGAAEILDVKPSTLESRMKKLGIRRPERLSKTRKPVSSDLFL